MSIKIDVREIDLFSLPALPLEDRLNLPDVCAAIYYALSKQQEILYIGRAQRLGQRWHIHHRLTQLEYIGRVKIAWLVIEPHVLIDPIWLEEKLIQHFCPLLNGTEIPLNMGNSYSLEEQSRGAVTLYQKREFKPILIELPSLWTCSYFSSTAGNVSQETIQRYLDAQKGV